MPTATARRAATVEPDYVPYGGCEDVLYAKEPEVLIAGPAGTGKSMACLYKLFTIADGIPGCRCLICRKTRASCTESALVTWEYNVLPEFHPALRGASRLTRHSYTFPNGSEVVIGGMDNADRILSTEYDVIFVQEATELHEEDWDKLASRLRHNKLPYQQLLGDCNPSAPSHWLKVRCDRSVCRMIESRHEDNPLLYDHERQDWTDAGATYLARLDRLSGVRRERLRYGRWVAAEGVVYDDYDAAVHVVDRFHMSSDWRRIRAVDFGYTNPFVCLWIAVDNDGRMYVYRYIYRSQGLVEDHARDIVRHSGNEYIEATVADHDAEDAATLKRHGVPTIKAKKDIRRGLEQVALRLRKDGSGRPRLFILRDSLVEADNTLVDDGRPWTLEQEFDCYIWPKATNMRSPREVPVDKDNHALDALRYAVMYVDNAPPRRSRASDRRETHARARARLVKL